MIEEVLIQYYGIFGAWTASNLAMIWYLIRANREDKKESWAVTREVTTALNDNTTAFKLLEAKFTNG